MMVRIIKREGKKDFFFFFFKKTMLPSKIEGRTKLEIKNSAIPSIIIDSGKQASEQ